MSHYIISTLCQYVYEDYMIFRNHDFYPIIKTDQFDKTVEFYSVFFDFEIAYKEENDFIVLKRKGGHKQYLGILSKNQKSLDNNLVSSENITREVVFNFYVDKLEPAYQQFYSLGADIIGEVSTARCGQKFFALREPNGNIVTVTEMSDINLEE